jgi:hypothetical protein
MISLVAAVARRPDLWPAAVALVPSRWWRRWPPLPVPSRSYMRFRMETMYGHDGHIDGEDLVRYLEWVRTMRRLAR